MPRSRSKLVKPGQRIPLWKAIPMVLGFWFLLMLVVVFLPIVKQLLSEELRHILGLTPPDNNGK